MRDRAAEPSEVALLEACELAPQEFDNTFPHLSGRHAPAGSLPAISTGQPASAQASAWHKPDASPRSNGASDTRWTSRLAQPASPAAPSTPLAANGVSDKRVACFVHTVHRVYAKLLQHAMAVSSRMRAGNTSMWASCNPVRQGQLTPMQKACAAFRCNPPVICHRPPALKVFCVAVIARWRPVCVSAARAPDTTPAAFPRSDACHRELAPGTYCQRACRHSSAGAPAAALRWQPESPAGCCGSSAQQPGPCNRAGCWARACQR